MTPRERFLRCVRGQEADRPPFLLFWGPWGDTWRHWEAQGKPPELSSFALIRDYFGAEPAPCVVPVNYGPHPRRPDQVIERTAEHRVFIDNWGIKKRDLLSGTSMPEFLEFPVKRRDDWERFKRQRLDPHHSERMAGDWLAEARGWMERGLPIQLGWFPDVGLFGGLRWLLGDEECLLSLHDDPQLVHDIMDHLTDLYLTVFEQVVARVRVDVIHLWEDLCGRQGPLLSPTHWTEFLGPRYRRIADFGQRHGIPVFSVDTDGLPDLLIEPMMACGVNFLLPLELAAGCDVNQYRRRHPDLAVMGGIDKRVLALGPAAIDRELARIAPAVATGRYIPELDHLIPSDVSWPNFHHYALALGRMLGVAAPAGASAGNVG